MSRDLARALARRGLSTIYPEKRALEGFASRQGIQIPTLPTGQGMLLNP